MSIPVDDIDLNIDLNIYKTFLLIGYKELEVFEIWNTRKINCENG